MDKNTLIGFALMGAVLVGFSIYNQPSEAELARQQQLQDSIIRTQQLQQQQKRVAEQEAKIRQEAARLDSTRLLFAAGQGQEQLITLENDLVKFYLSTKGGMPRNVELKKYTDQDRETPIRLFADPADKLSFSITGKTENVITDDLYLQLVEQTDSSVIMRLPMGKGYIDFTYQLHRNNYMLDLKIQAVNVSDYFAPDLRSLNLNLHEKARQLEKGFAFENRYATLTYKEKDGGTDYLSETSEDQETPEELLDWVAFKNQFFSCVFIAGQDFDNVKLTSAPQKQNSGYLKDYSAQLSTFFDPTGKQPTTLQFYFGPNHYPTLQDADELSISGKELDLEELVYLGWPLFRYINRWFTLYVFNWLSGWGLNMGIVLLLMTIIINILVYPTRYKSYISSAKMRVLKPKVDAINAKYPNQEDAMRKQQEIMQLYSQYGVSPMGGCLPMLLQMPIWIALFNFVPNAIELRQQSFLWADDLSTYDDIISWGTHIWGLGNHLSLFCLGFCATNVITTVINMKQQDTGANPQMAAMKWMMYVMPVMFFFIFNDYSSGLCWYYFVSGLIGVGIMWILKATTDEAALLAKLEKRREERKANPRKSGGFQERLQKMAEKQQEILRQQQEQQKRNKR